MALQGTLETFSVPEVLRLLAGTRKTGMLALDGDRGAGQVWLGEGRIVGARSANEPEGDVEPVLFDLLRYEVGSFVFEPDTPYTGGSPADADVETALAAAEALLEEWHEIAAVVPSLRVWLSMVPAITTAEVTVTAEQWAALAIVGRGTSGERLADELGLGELDGSRRICELVESGLVQVDDDAPLEPSVVVDPSAAPVEDLGEEGTWTTTDDLSVGLAGFVARSAEEERSEDVPDLDVTAFEAPLTPAPADDVFHVADADADAGDDLDVFGDDDTSEAVEPVAASDAAEREPAPEQEPAAAAVDGPDADDEDAGSEEFLSQLANLSPKAAAAIEATASADETSSRRLPNGEGDEEINRNLLLKFLSSAKP